MKRIIRLGKAFRDLGIGGSAFWRKAATVDADGDLVVGSFDCPRHHVLEEFVSSNLSLFLD